MKVLKLKNVNNLDQLRVKRGFNEILPFLDADLNYIIGMDILEDPSYIDLHEHILDLCEIVEYKEPLPNNIQETPFREPKGEFAAIRAESKDLEEAVTKYYDSKMGIIGKIARFIGF